MLIERILREDRLIGDIEGVQERVMAYGATFLLVSIEVDCRERKIQSPVVFEVRRSAHFSNLTLVSECFVVHRPKFYRYSFQFPSEARSLLSSHRGIVAVPRNSTASLAMSRL